MNCLNLQYNPFLGNYRFEVTEKFAYLVSEINIQNNISIELQSRMTAAN